MCVCVLVLVLVCVCVCVCVSVCVCVCCIYAPYLFFLLNVMTDFIVGFDSVHLRQLFSSPSSFFLSGYTLCTRVIIIITIVLAVVPASRQ